MSEVRASLIVGEFELAVAARWRDRFASPRLAIAEAGRRSWRLSGHDAATAAISELPTVRDFTVSPSRRLADAVASAAIVRDVAAFGALILFGTMLAVVLSSADMLV
jgi:hypothetical protein